MNNYELPGQGTVLLSRSRLSASEINTFHALHVNTPLEKSMCKDNFVYELKFVNGSDRIFRSKRRIEMNDDKKKNEDKQGKAIALGVGLGLSLGLAMGPGIGMLIGLIIALLRNNGQSE